MIWNLKELYDDPKDISRTKLNSYTGGILYRIHNLVTDKSYIGITKVLWYRLFSTKFGHLAVGYDKGENHKLYNSMRKHSLENFQLEVLLKTDDISEPRRREEEFISIYDSYHNGYNLSYNGKATWKLNGGMPKGYIAMNNGMYSTFVSPDDIEEYEDRGFVKGRLGCPNKDLVAMNNGEIYRYVTEEVFHLHYEPYGWKRGRGSTPTRREYETNHRYLNNGVVTRKVSEKDVTQYLSNGWVEGRLDRGTHLGRLYITDGSITKVIDESEFSIYESQGFRKGQAPRKVRKRWMITPDDESSIQVNSDLVEEYLSKGYRIGRIIRK